MKDNNIEYGIIDYAIDEVECLDDVYGSDVHHNLFNTGSFIALRKEAQAYLDSIGILDAIAKIIKYESEELGKVTTDFSDPVAVCNMYAYITGLDILNECPVLTENWNNKLTEKQLKKLVKQLKGLKL